MNGGRAESFFIHEELGSFNDVLSRKLKHSIRHASREKLADELDAFENKAGHAAAEDELESVRKSQEQLR